MPANFIADVHTSPETHDIYDPTDYKELRTRTMDNVLDAVHRRFPMENERYQLKITDVQYGKTKPFTKKEQKQAILNGSSLNVPLKGKWQLVNKETGDIVSKTNQKVIMNVPWITERGTYIRNGHEESLNVQMRLVPGVYVRKRDNGEVEAHVNVKQGSGQMFKIQMEPSTGVFHILTGSRKLKLYPVLKGMGLTDDQISAKWGPQLLKANVVEHNRNAIKGVRQFMKTAAERDHRDELNPEEMEQLKQVFGRMELDETSTARTLGKAYKNVTPDALLDTTTRLVRLAKGEIAEDKRDSLEHQRFYTAPDLFSERVLKDAGNVGRTLMWKMSNHGNLDKLPSGALNPYINSFFTSSNLNQVTEEVNPLDIHQRNSRVTRMGEGGIGNLRAAPFSARLVHNSYKGFIDPAQTPESLRAGLDNQLAHNIRKGSNGLMYTQLRNKKTGQLEWVSTLKAAKAAVSMPDTYDKTDTFVPVIIGDTLKYIRKNEVDYEVPTGDSLFATTSNFVPLKSGAKAGRLLMGCLSGKTLITVHRADGTIFYNKISKYKHSVGDKIKSLSDTGQETLEEIRAVVPNDKKLNMLKVTLEDGKTLITTVNHKWVTVEANNILRQILAEDLELDMFIPCSRSLINSQKTQSENQWVDSDIVLRKIKKIEKRPIEDITYDLDLNDKTFMVANGIFVHNSKHGTQALSLTQREAPFVQTLTPDDNPNSFEDDMGTTLGAVKANKPGTVIRVDKNRIKVQNADGSVDEHDLYDNFPYNRKTFLRNEPLVKAGDKVGKGSILAKSNYTDDKGVSALGKNLRTAYMAYHGENYKDAVIISEGAAKKLTSEHMYQDKVVKQKGVIYDKDRFIAKFPGKFTKEQYDTLGENGTVKPGTVVHYGDPLSVAFKENPPTYASMGRKIFSKQIKTWEHPFDGIVTDVAEGKKGNKILIRADVPMQEGDKMCYSEDTFVRVRESNGYYKNIKDITLNDEILTLNINTGETEYNLPTHIHKYKHVAKMHRMHTEQIDILTTLNHKHVVKEDGKYVFRRSDDILNKEVNLVDALQTGVFKVKAENHSVIDYIGFVYCVTVPNHTLLVQRNNKSEVWSGNSGRYGNKGVVAKIIPDHLMPQTKEGVPMEVLMGPTGIVSRTNSAQVVEAQLGKVARKTGKTYRVPGFMRDNIMEFAEKELEKAGLKPNEDLIDPITGKTVKDISTGESYIYKLHHTSESKGSSRNTGGYTLDELPATGGKEGAKRLGNLVLSSIVAHDAHDVLKDAKLIRGQKNDDFWRDFKTGKTPAMPKTPLVYQKFIESLRGSGINVHENGHETHIFAMTDKDVKNLTGGRQVTNTHTYDNKTYQPVKGGLFGLDVFGPQGNQWGYIKLDEPIPNPIMEEPIRQLLDLSKTQYNAVVSGAKQLNNLTGGAAFTKALSRLNIDNEIEKTQDILKNGQPNQRDKALKKFRYLQALKKNKAKPEDFMLSRIPVMPPKFRPITATDDLTMVSDSNYLYKELLEAQTDLQQAAKVLPPSMLTEPRAKIYNTFKSITGLSDPDSKQLQQKNVGGFLQWIFGKGSPKCYDDKTEVLTAEGWIPFKEYTDSNVKLATLNPKTDLFEWQNPVAIIHEPYQGEMIHTKTNKLDTLVTPNHYHYVSKKVNNKWLPYAKVKASELIGVSNVRYKQEEDSQAVVEKDYQTTSIDYYGHVHCATVENGLLFTRRNDRVIVSGNSGNFQRNVVGSTMDVSGRSVVTPNSSLKLDEVGLPEKQAWGLYEPFIVRKLVQKGSSAKDAVMAVAKKKPIARKQMEEIMKERPLIITRAPALHKYSVMATKPKLVKGSALQVSPVIEDPFNLDHDGNCVDHDTEILLKLSQSALDKSKNLWYNTLLSKARCLDTNLLKKESTMKIAANTEVVLRGNDQLLTVKAGELPKEGKPKKDKNGADVYGVPAGVEILSYDHETGKRSFNKITQYTEEFNCPSVEVKTKTQSVIVSDNESLAIFDHETGEINKQSPIGKEGAFVPVLNKINHFGLKGDYDYGWWIGAFVSDGWLSGKTIGYAKKEEAKRDKFIEVARQQIHINFLVKTYHQKGQGTSKKYADSVKIHLSGQDLVDEVSLLNVTAPSDSTGRQAIHKQLPNELLNSLTEKALWGLLAGLIDGDGSVVKNTSAKNPRYTFKLATSSPNLKEGVCKVSYRLGIRTSITVHPPRNKSREAYDVYFSTIDMKRRSGGNLFFIGEREHTLYTEFMQAPTKYKISKDILPLTKAEGATLKKIAYAEGFNGFYASLSKKQPYLKCNLYNLREILQIINENKELVDMFNPEEYKRLFVRAFTEEVRWEAVESVVDKGKRNVYDFEVKDTKIFATGNGLIIWDTMSYYVPVTDAAVKEAYEKMLPSKNLLGARFFDAHYIPEEEYILGMHLATRKKEGPIVASFKTVAEAKEAYKRGQIKADDNIKILEGAL